jgi:hypothetical protein
MKGTTTMGTDWTQTLAARGAGQRSGFYDPDVPLEQQGDVDDRNPVPARPVSEPGVDTSEVNQPPPPAAKDARKRPVKKATKAAVKKSR